MTELDCAPLLCDGVRGCDVQLCVYRWRSSLPAARGGGCPAPTWSSPSAWSRRSSRICRCAPEGGAKSSSPPVWPHDNAYHVAHQGRVMRSPLCDMQPCTLLSSGTEFRPCPQHVWPGHHLDVCCVPAASRLSMACGRHMRFRNISAETGLRRCVLLASVDNVAVGEAVQQASDCW